MIQTGFESRVKVQQVIENQLPNFILDESPNTAEFLKLCKEANINGIKGHRSVGGFRASIYNALPIESVQVLVDVMKNFKP